MNKIEKLLQPRYLVIAPWPGGQHKSGQIIVRALRNYFECIEDQTLPMVHRPQDYPANLRRMHWSEGRDLADLPEYVQVDTDKSRLFNGNIHKVRSWHINSAGNLYLYLTDDVGPLSDLFKYSPETFIPATEEQYLEYINSKQ